MLKVWVGFLLERGIRKTQVIPHYKTTNIEASSEAFFCDLTMEGLMTLIFDQKSYY